VFFLAGLTIPRLQSCRLVKRSRALRGRNASKIPEPGAEPHGLLVALAFCGRLLLRPGLLARVGPVLEPIASSRDGDDLGVMQEPVQDRRGRRNIADQLAPVLQGAVRGHHGGADLVPPHDDLEQVFAGPLGQLLHPKIIDDEQVRLEIAGQDLLLTVEGLVLQEVPHHVEDRAVQHRVTRFDRLVADRLA
jgi:hypothetical protein